MVEYTDLSTDGYSVPSLVEMTAHDWSDTIGHGCRGVVKRRRHL